MRPSRMRLVVLAGVAMWAGCSSDSKKSAEDALAGDTKDVAGDVNSDLNPGDLVGDSTLLDTNQHEGGDLADVVVPPETAVLQTESYSLGINTTLMQCLLSRGDQVVLTLNLSEFAAGVVDKVDDVANYDPYLYLVKAPLYVAPPGLKWVTPASAQIVATDATTIEVRLDYPAPEEGGKALTALLKIQTHALGRFKLEWLPEANDRWAIFKVGSGITATEGLYGLGEFFDQVNHRGMIRAMQMEADGTLESAYNEVHVPIPFLIGTEGWGMFVQSWYPGAFDFSKPDATKFDVYFGTGTASDQGLTFYVMTAEHPLDLTNHYYQLTGYPKLPARWALGPWVWRDENDNQAQVENDLNTLRDLDLATTGYWIDRPYATGVNTFDYDPAKFPDSDSMIALMHSLGFRTALWHTPYLDEKDDSTKALRDEATSKGYYPKKYGMLLNKWGKPIDLSNPDAFAWWKGLIKKYADMGVEGFKLDYAEDVVPGLSGKRLNIWEFFNGEDERTMHQRYTLFYHQVYAENLPAEGGFLLCRHGAPGDQVNGPIIWPGDLDADMSKHREVIQEEGGGSYGAVGGLPAAVVASITLGPSGFPFFGSDTGGYRHSPPDEETFIRWFQHTALSTVMQIGTSSNDVAWEMFDAQSDPDGKKLDLYRTMTRLHLRLFPYEWTYAQRLLQDGRPIQRPMGLARPEMGVHPSDQYFFGESLLVAPVVTKGQVEREVHFPEGKWLDWWSGEVVEGGSAKLVDAPLEKLPLYLEQGGIIPLLRPTIDAMGPTLQPDRVDSMATDAGILYARVFAGSQRSEFELYDGALLAAQLQGTGMTLEYSEGDEFNAGAMFEVMAFGLTAPTSVMDGATEVAPVGSLAELDNVPSGWYFQAEMGGVLWVKVMEGSHTISIE